MVRPIKFPNTEFNVLREEAALQGRSIVDQAVHWQKIGRLIERSGSFDYSRIRDALNSRLDPDELTRIEQEYFFQEFADAMLIATPEQEVFFASLLNNGLAVGLDENDGLVYSNSSPSPIIQR